MKINLNYDTSKMTKEERLKVRKEIQEVLDQLNHELKTASFSQHRHFGHPTMFFGVSFDFDAMTNEELLSVQRDARHLAANILMWHDNLPAKYTDPVKTFFDDVEFNFAKMSKKDLSNSKDECHRLLTNITKQCLIRKL